MIWQGLQRLPWKINKYYFDGASLSFTNSRAKLGGANSAQQCNSAVTSHLNRRMHLSGMTTGMAMLQLHFHVAPRALPWTIADAATIFNLEGELTKSNKREADSIRCLGGGQLFEEVQTLTTSMAVRPLHSHVTRKLARTKVDGYWCKSR